MKPYGKMGVYRWNCPCCDLFRTGRGGLKGAGRNRRLRVLKKRERQAIRKVINDYLKGG